MPLRSGWAVSLTFALAVAAAATGCDRGHGSKSAPDAGSLHTIAGMAPEQAARVIAKVGDRTITLGDFAAALEHMDQFDRLRYQSPERRVELLHEMIRIELLAQEAVAKGYDKDPIAAEELRAVLRDAVLEDAKRGTPTPAEIPAAEARAYFEAHRADYKDPERRRLSVLVARDEAAAAAAIEAYKKNPTLKTWGELVVERSLDPQARANVPLDLAGDYGFVSPPGDPRGANPRIPEEVRVAAFALPSVGDVTPTPVKAGGKIYVVRLFQKVEARERNFEDAERTIRVKLAQDGIEKKERELLDGLRKQHPVQIDEAALAQVHVESGPSDAGAKD
jgi:hypothetical protein